MPVADALDRGRESFGRHELGAPLLHAVSGYATGSVLLGEHEARGALVALRPAWAACGSWTYRTKPLGPMF